WFSGGLFGVSCLGLCVLESAPCPDSCRLSASGWAGQGPGGSPAGVAGAWRASLMRPPGERIMPGGRGRKGVGGVGGGLGAFVGGVTGRGGRGREGGGSQPYLGPRGAGRCPGDKMIDWVSPPAGVRPLSLISRLWHG